MLLAGGITAWILAQALINIGGVVGMLPVTGLHAAVRVLRRLVAAGHDGGRRPALNVAAHGRETVTRPARRRVAESALQTV